MKINQITENMSHTAKRIHDIEKEKGVTPGTPEWFKLWFSLPYLKESITEALDNPYPFELIGPNDSQEFSALAQTPNGMLRMDFEATDYDNFGIDFSVGKSMGKTEAGDEFKVFATVVAMMTKWIKTVGIEHVESFDFGANKGEHASDGRAKLYTRFAKQLASKLGWKLDQSTTGNGDTAFFKLTNPNPTPREQEYWDAIEETVNEATISSQQMLTKLSKEMQGTHTGVMDINSDWSKFVLSHKGFTLKDIQVDQIPTAVKSDGMSQANIEKYKKADTSQFPPMVIGNDGYLLDGNHRLQAYKAQGIKTVKAYIGENETVNEATEMKISDLTISDAGMAIAQSAGGGSRTDAPLTVTKLPSGHVYLVNGYHRLIDAMKSGKDTVAVKYVPYKKVEILWKQEREDDIKYGKQFNEGKQVNEGYKLKLERDADMMVLNITDTTTGKRTEVRGKAGYETNGYDANDKLHKLLDKISKSANISELMNGEVVGINPKHPDGKSAKSATDTAFNENFADGKVKGKSRPGRVKKSGASCNGSVTELRAKAKKASGEKAKMYHWCANMKAGKKK